MGKQPQEPDYLQMAKDYVIPPHRLGQYNNIHWNMNLPVEVLRMDHTLSMSQHLGSLTNAKGQRMANVSLALGGFALVITPMTYKGKGRAAFALDLKQTCAFILNLVPDLGKVEEAPHVQKVVSKVVLKSTRPKRHDPTLPRRKGKPRQ